MIKHTFTKFLLLLTLAASAHAYTNLTGCGTITEGNQNYQITAGTMSSSSGPCLTINGSGASTLDITCTAGVGATTIVSTDASAPAVKIQSSAYGVTFHQCGFTGPVNAVTVDSSSHIWIGDPTFGPGIYPVSGSISVSNSNYVQLAYLAFGTASAALYSDSDYGTVEYCTFTSGTNAMQGVIKVAPSNGDSPHLTQQFTALYNIIDGGWDPTNGNGADDGMYIVGCNSCTIEFNDIRKVWDGGIELAGPITSSTISLNSISAVGVAAINGYYNFSLDSSHFDSNYFCNGLWGLNGSNHVCNTHNLNGHNSKLFHFSNITGYLGGWNTQTVKFSNTDFNYNCAFTPNSATGYCATGWGGSGVTKYTGGTSIDIDMTQHDSGGYSYTTAVSFTGNWIDYNQASSGTTITMTSMGSPTASSNKCGTASSPLSCASLP
jgi:hypothetical protein